MGVSALKCSDCRRACLQNIDSRDFMAKILQEGELER
jgi:hypothetical protein